jgi:signal transduction histidine kinase
MLMATIFNHPLPYLATAVFAFLIRLYVRKQPDRPGTRHFRWLLGVWLAWALAAALQITAGSQELRYLMWVLQSVCVLVGIPLQLLVTLEYTGVEKKPVRRILFLLFLPAFLFAVISIILPSSLVSIQVQSGIEVLAASRLTRWTFIPYAMILIFIMLAVLFSFLLRAPAFRTPILLIILAQFVAAMGYLLVDPQRLIVSPIHIAILLSNFNILAYFLALYNFGLLRVIPVARDAIIAHMPYPLIILDADDRLVDFNPAAQKLPDLPGKLVLNQSGEKAMGSWWKHFSKLISSENSEKDVIVQTGSGEKIFRVQSLPLLQTSGWRMGQVFVLEDVTRAREAQQQRTQAMWAQATLQEREQLAHELHDGLSQSLAFLNLQAQAAQLYLQGGQAEPAEASLRRLTEAAGEIQEDTRELIDSLLSVSLPAENICVTLHRIMKGFERQTGLTTRLEMTGEECFDPPRLPPSVAVHLVRITQESLANVRKHARGVRQVSVQLEASEDQLYLTIKDDGDGFDPVARRPAGKHYGLQVMRQRASRIGGRVTIESTHGEGTQVMVEVPLKGEAKFG